MSRRSPLLDLHAQGEGLPLQYGPSDPAEAVALVAAFDPVAVEYAAVRTHAALFDAAHRATLVVTGDDRIAFLNRMLTQEFKGAQPWTARRAFWLNRKGRIDADLRAVVLPDRVLLDVDVHAAERARSGLESFIVADDVRIEDATERHHRLALHGPAAAAILARASTHRAGTPVAGIAPGQAAAVDLGGAEITVDRQDMTGEIGLELLVPADRAVTVYEALTTPWSARGTAARGHAPSPIAPTTDLARRVGWHALNIARVEAGWPLYYTDFGPDSLPHETGDWCLNDRVSFKKGCYLGQEIVARMQALGHPKQKLAALRFDAAPESASAALPEGTEPPQAVTGTPLAASDAPDAPTVGAVTSSAVSPMLGGAPIAFAMLKHASAAPGTTLTARVDTETLHATVQPAMTFFKR